MAVARRRREEAAQTVLGADLLRRGRTTFLPGRTSHTTGSCLSNRFLMLPPPSPPPLLIIFACVHLLLFAFLHRRCGSQGTKLQRKRCAGRAPLEGGMSGICQMKRQGSFCDHLKLMIWQTLSALVAFGTERRGGAAPLISCCCYWFFCSATIRRAFSREPERTGLASVSSQSVESDPGTRAEGRREWSLPTVLLLHAAAPVPGAPSWAGR